jgi:hypothetical protein
MRAAPPADHTPLGYPPPEEGPGGRTAHEKMPEAQPGALYSPEFAELAKRAEAEHPALDDRQIYRHGAMLRFQQLSKAERERIFDESLVRALALEKITDPAVQAHWKRWAREVVAGGEVAPRRVAENPDFNPFMVDGETGGHPGKGTAVGYYQFILYDPKDRAKDPYEHRQWNPNGGLEWIYDPVTQHRMFIRSICREGSTHKCDPQNVAIQKRNQGWWKP